MPKSEIEVGNEVQYKADFLRSIGCYTGKMPRARGKVTNLKNLGGSITLAEIEWNLPDVPNKVNVKNLKKLKNNEPS